MTLQRALDRAGASQSDLAGYLGLARSTVNGIVRRGAFPVGRGAAIRRRINEYLIDRGVAPEGLWKQVPVDDNEAEEAKECEMISKKAKKHFGVFRDPFIDDVNSASDVYMGGDARYAAEYMYTTAKVGGMLAVIGESGSGKTTLRRLLLDRINTEELKIKVIFPRIIDKERLTATSICDAIISDCSTEKPRRTLEAKARQIERILTDSLKSGWKHVLMIEEAHDLTVRTLKYLKRFWELESGFEKLLSIILIAQPELREKLDESRNYEAREIIRRMEVAEIRALESEGDLSGYLELKLRRIGSDPGKLIDPAAYAAILAKLTRKTRSGSAVCLAYPLTVNNLIKRALNVAAEVGQARITAETIEAA